VQLPSGFEGSAAFPGNSPRPQAPTGNSTAARRWCWPWQRAREREGDRVIALNDERANLAEGHCSNYVSTSKYNLATFFPKFFTGVSSQPRFIVYGPEAGFAEQFSK
jgi:phospholipid-transporting ATPase